MRGQRPSYSGGNLDSGLVDSESPRYKTPRSHTTSHNFLPSLDSSVFQFSPSEFSPGIQQTFYTNAGYPSHFQQSPRGPIPSHLQHSPRAPGGFHSSQLSPRMPLGTNMFSGAALSPAQMSPRGPQVFTNSPGNGAFFQFSPSTPSEFLAPTNWQQQSWGDSSDSNQPFPSPSNRSALSNSGHRNRRRERDPQSQERERTDIRQSPDVRDNTQDPHVHTKKLADERLGRRAKSLSFPNKVEPVTYTKNTTGGQTSNYNISTHSSTSQEPKGVEKALSDNIELSKRRSVRKKRPQTQPRKRQDTITQTQSQSQIPRQTTQARGGSQQSRVKFTRSDSNDSSDSDF
eukprot:TRINITY_DN749_c0_g2_i1.p1 TRINITY_DN749_c0_g2~~TRINITY_DN749_c0_g2_i1.p1  ORF type:complete len:372 (+),score=43.99 TRINITY_DN749_c0_g2_i1:85-1116(+)